MVILLLALFACKYEPCTPMTEGPDGLRVTYAEHPTGYGRTDCFTCHAAPALHREGCTANVDYGEVDRIVAAQGEASCVTCHGPNADEPDQSDSDASDSGVADGGAR